MTDKIPSNLPRDKFIWHPGDIVIESPETLAEIENYKNQMTLLEIELEVKEAEREVAATEAEIRRLKREIDKLDKEIKS